MRNSVIPFVINQLRKKSVMISYDLLVNHLKTTEDEVCIRTSYYYYISAGKLILH